MIIISLNCKFRIIISNLVSCLNKNTVLKIIRTIQYAGTYTPKSIIVLYKNTHTGSLVYDYSAITT